MIISHSHRFIFVKSLKTAGTSVEAALSGLCSGSDVVTPLGPYAFNRDESGRWVHQSMNDAGHEQHEVARSIRASLPAPLWDGYFKFSIARNPWDRALSYFFWAHRQEALAAPRRGLLQALGLQGDDFASVRQRFAAFVHGGALENNDAFYVGDDGRPCVDFVMRYEQLPADFARVCERLGVEAPPIPRLKTGIRKDRRPYTDYYDESTREAVARIHHNDLRLFGYAFGEPVAAA